MVERKTAESFLKNIGKFHIAFVMNCNLRCSYCITDHGTYGRSPAVLSSENQEIFITRFLDRCEHPVELEFGTGETMLAFDQFISFVDRVRSFRKKKGIRDHLSVTTNGTLLDKKKIDTLLERGIVVIFSIDGDEQMHTFQRTNSQGQTHHAKILDNYYYYIQRMEEMGVSQNTTVMGVLTRGNSLTQVDKFWNSQGRDVKYSVSLALPRDYKDPVEIAEYREIQNQYLLDLEKIAFEKAAYYKNPSFLNEYSGPLEIYEGWCNLLLDKATSHQCGVFESLLTVTGHGEFYPCELCLNLPEMKLGSLEEGFSHKDLERLQGLAGVFENQCSGCRVEASCPSVCFVERYGLSPVGKDFSACDFAIKVDDIVKRSYEVLEDLTI